MGRWAKLRDRVLSGRSDQNVEFREIVGYLTHLGFSLRTRGDHFILTRSDVVEILNLQPTSAGKAKPYQVRQVRGVIAGYRLGGDDD